MILVIFLSRSFYNGIGFQTMLKISKYDTWISILIGFGSPHAVNTNETSIITIIQELHTILFSKFFN